MSYRCWVNLLERFLTGRSDADINHAGILGRNLAPGQALSLELRNDSANRWLFHNSEFDNAAEVEVAISLQCPKYTSSRKIDAGLAQARANSLVELTGRPIQQIGHKGP